MLAELFIRYWKRASSHSVAHSLWFDAQQLCNLVNHVKPQCVCIIVHTF